jgi:iron complex outermembrane receptor protein
MLTTIQGGNDGNNIQIDLNYGTNSWKGKSFINATASAQLRGQTSRAKDVTGNLFNRYNAEERARIAGININSLLVNTLNTTLVYQWFG